MAEEKTLVFKIGEGLYGLDIDTVQGIENVKGFTAIPNISEHIKGIINLRGNVIPVYSLRKKFGLANIEKDELQLIIVNVGDIQVAIEIDQIDVIQDVNDDMIHQVPSIVRTPYEQYYKNVISVNERLIVVLDPEKLISENELNTMNELISE